MLPLNQRLFPHLQAGHLYFHANNTAFEVDTSMRILRERPCTGVSFANQFVQYYCPVEYESEHYALAQGVLIKLNGLECTQICTAPASSYRYKVATFSGELYCLGELGELHVYENGSFLLTEGDFLKGDSYIYSHEVGGTPIEIAVNLTTQILYFKANDYSVRQALGDCVTVDLITPFYILMHGGRGSMFVDFTTRDEGFTVYRTEQREKMLEWNELPQNLYMMQGFWLCKQDLLGAFTKLDVAGLYAKINETVGVKPDAAQNEQQRPHRLESNEIWEFGPIKAQAPDIVTDMRGNVFEFKKNAPKVIPVRAEKAASSFENISNAALSKAALFAQPKAVEEPGTVAEMQLALIEEGRKIENLEKEVVILQQNYKLNQEILLEVIGMLDEGKKSDALGKILKKMNAQ